MTVKRTFRLPAVRSVLSATRTRHGYSNSGLRAFTLIEVLVSVAIISLLLAILLPSLAKARDAAQGASCLSNLRQLAMASHSYTNGHRGRYPLAYWQQYAAPKVIMAAWDFTTIRDWSSGTTRVKPGLLWQGHTNPQVQQCPNYQGTSNTVADPYTGYNYNTSYIGHGGGEQIQSPARIDDIRQPAATALFGDGEYADGANKFMRAPFNDLEHGGDYFSDRATGTQGYRHQQRTNVAFCDGHAQSWRPCHLETGPNQQPRIAPGTGFLSANNDLYDLR